MIGASQLALQQLCITKQAGQRGTQLVAGQTEKLFLPLLRCVPFGHYRRQNQRRGCRDPGKTLQEEQSEPKAAPPRTERRPGWSRQWRGQSPEQAPSPAAEVGSSQAYP